MTTHDHLNRIAAKCRALLAIAEKRTPGSWRQESIHTEDGSCAVLAAGINDYGDGPSDYVTDSIPRGVLPGRNARYIAACAGPAEAGWRSTIAAIEMACEMRAHLLAEFGDGWRCDFVDDKIKLILAAWPEELL